MHSAMDGSKLRTRNNHGLYYLISSERQDGHPGSDPGNYPLSHLVNGLLSQLREVAAHDIFNDPGAVQIQEIEGQLGEVERRLEVARHHFRTEKDSTVWAEEVTALDRQRRVLLGQRDEAKRAAANPVSATWSEAIDLMKRNDPARLRQCLLQSVESVWCLFVKRSQSDRLAAVQVRFDGGARRDYLIYSHIPCGNGGRKRKDGWAAISLAETVPSAFDLRERKQAGQLARLLSGIDLDVFKA